MKKKIFISLILFFAFLSACSPKLDENAPSLLTVVAMTQKSAARQTARAESFFTATPTVATLRPTMTLQPTGTVYIISTRTPTFTFTPTKTPYIRTTWPDWKLGEVIRLNTSGFGTSKRFEDLEGLMVIVTRERGVKMRPIPSNAIGGPMEEVGSAFILTGVMNKSPQHGWIYAQVIAADGRTYWVGGSEGTDSDPAFALAFYYPELTPSPTPFITATPTLPGR